MLVLAFMFTSMCFAQVPAASPSPASGAIVLQGPAGGILAPVDPSYQPPAWLDTAIKMTMGLPLVGPYIVMLMQWLGVFAAIMTALCAFLMVAIKALSGVLTVAQLDKIAIFVASLEHSKMLYWMKRLSLFNAPPKKDESIKV